ncbi:acyl-CoA N-acyltransferase [Trichoderma novae-zelandiae]
MAFIISTPSEEDAPAIPTVHLRAMDANLLTHAQFPSPEGLRFFHGWLATDTVGHIRDGDKGVLAAKEERTGQIVSFVKWLVHRPGDDGAEEGRREEWPEVARGEYLDPYAELTGRVRDGVMGKGAAYYHPTYLCTDPSWAGRGAASVLLRKVQDLAAEEGLPVVLEATMNAVGFYEKMGFEVRDELSMMLPARGASEPTEIYEERCMVWVPGKGNGGTRS